ncbi:MAG TPA: hypothetical protein VGB53_14230 [Rubricoccaceae bacterium]|jgi:hypothetical protein
MGYLIAQIAVCLLLAALLGGGIGWLLRGRPAAPDGGALDTATRRIADLERELAESRGDPPAAGGPPHGGGLAASPAGPISSAASAS